MKNTKYKVNSWVITAVVVIAVILVNLIVTTISSKVPLKIDLTEDKIYEISDETKDILKNLDVGVKAYVLAPEENVSIIVKEYIERYKQLTNKIDFQYIDIYKNQTMLTKYQQLGEAISEGDIILEYGDSYKVISVASLVKNLSSTGESSMSSLDLEAKLTNGILFVTGKVTENNFYFLEGHGEAKTATFDTVIESKDNEIETISIINADIPEDADVLATVMPSTDFSKEECEKIDAFLDNGGKLIVLYSPGLNSCPRFESYLSEWGITPVHGAVVENDSTKSAGSPIEFFPTLQEHEITSNILSLKLPVMFVGGSMGFEILENNPQKATVTSLAKSSSNSFVETNLESQSPEFNDGDLQGPVDLCVLSEKQVVTDSGEEKTASIFVLGNALAVELTQQHTGNSANSEFTENTVTYLTNSSDSLQISSKIITTGLFTRPNDVVITVLYYVLIWLIPCGLLIAGIVIWLKRRYL